MTKPNLLTQVKIHMKMINYSPSTIQSYTQWIKRFVIYNRKTHPAKLGPVEIKDFIGDLESITAN